MADQRAAPDIADLVAEHHAALYGYAYRLTGVVSDAEDLTQQVFLIAQQKLPQLREPAAARSWLYTILRRCFSRSLQQNRPVLAESLQLDIENVPEDVGSETWIDQERLELALNDLPAEFRSVLVMFFFEDCSYREIAEALEIPIGTVMSRLARAKSRLRTSLFDAEDMPARTGREQAN
jgi:RNA polymerase sigma-70 factor (ECF subfamily)